jgi:hypothetical protein
MLYAIISLFICQSDTGAFATYEFQSGDTLRIAASRLDVRINLWEGEDLRMDTSGFVIKATRNCIDVSDSTRPAITGPQHFEYFSSDSSPRTPRSLLRIWIPRGNSAYLSISISVGDIDISGLSGYIHVSHRIGSLSLRNTSMTVARNEGMGDCTVIDNEGDIEFSSGMGDTLLIENNRGNIVVKEASYSAIVIKECEGNIQVSSHFRNISLTGGKGEATLSTAGEITTEGFEGKITVKARPVKNE